MLPTLSKQELDAIREYNEQTRNGDVDENPVWADSFTKGTFRNFPEDGELVDIGCGLGRIIQITYDLGINHYFGIDPSEERVKYCKKQYPEFNFEVEEIRTIGKKYPKRFSGFWLTAVLMHIPREHLGIALKSIHDSLKDGSIGFCATPSGFPDYLETRTRSGLKITLFTPEELSTAFQQNGFLIGTMMLIDGMLIWNCEKV